MQVLMVVAVTIGCLGASVALAALTLRGILELAFARRRAALSCPSR